MTASDPSGSGAFDELMGDLTYPMFVVTTISNEERSGCLVGFATQAGINPSRFLVGISDKNHTFQVAKAATHLAVHLLRDDDLTTARLFGEKTGDEIDKFAHCAWQEGPAGLPILDSAAAWFVGRIRSQVRLGDHVGFLLEVESSEFRDRDATFLTSQEVIDFEPGHLP